MPARRRKKLLFKSNKKRKFKKLLLLILSVLIVLIFLIYLFRKDKWNGKEKLSLAVRNTNGSVSILIFDPQLSEIYRINIPANTEIKVAGEYGNWKIKSLWDLGVQEGVYGDILARSITMGMKLPIYAWGDVQALDLAEDNFIKSIKSLFYLYKTNLTIGDKLRLALFSLKINNTKRITINLEDTSYLEKRTLPDGEVGYVISQNQSQKVLSLFSEPYISKNMSKIFIKDSTGKYGISKNVGEVVQVLGAKVSLVEQIDSVDDVCWLKSKDIKILKIYKKIFDCERNDIDQSSSFDLEIVLGNKFPNKY